MPAGNFFRVALVVHVDLSVLVWFIAMAGMLWTLDSSERRLTLGWIALFTTAAGATLIALSPFVGPAVPIMSNYVPVLDSPVFLYGLAVIGAGFAMLVSRAFLAAQPLSLKLDGSDALRFGLKASSVAAALALLALAWSFHEVPRELAAQTYYELLFWGPGHVIQFAWTLLMLVGWAWLSQLAGSPLPLPARVVALVYLIALMSVFVSPLIYLNWTVLSIEHQRMMTWLMRFGGGLAILPMVLALALALLAGRVLTPAQAPLRAALVCSLLLFSVGGLIGFMIRGSDVRVPAHYHGSIVGVTLALMGMVYALLPRFGFRAPVGRLAAFQPWLYGGGQLLHIAGLLWSGGYGVQRKVAGAEQVLRSPQEVFGMALMGLGGLAAILGGMLFVLVVIRSIALRCAPVAARPSVRP
jgi:hypothetical protein